LNGCDARRARRQAFLSTKFGVSLVGDVVVAACAVDEPSELDPDEDAELTP
jgi:hypothetical protein